MSLKRLLVVFWLISFLFIARSPLMASDFLDALASPKGVAVVTATYGVVSGIANFFWAFNWAYYTPVTPQTGATLQMSGGLVASGASFVLGGLVPVLVYKWAQKHPAAAPPP